MDKSSFSNKANEAHKSSKDVLWGEMSEQAKVEGCLDHETSEKLLDKMKNAK